MSLIFLFLVSCLGEEQHVEEALQNVISTASYMSENAGIQLGVSLPGKTLSVATGYKDRSRSLELQPSDRMPIGSGTKMFTAAAMLRMVDQGKVNLEAKALPHMDFLIRNITKQSLVHSLGPQVKDVTVRQLLHMTSGIGDMDSKSARDDMVAKPLEEISLDRFTNLVKVGAHERGTLGQSDQIFTCMPGTCGEYSSTNYFLLGLMLSQLSGAGHWLDYDQSSFLPASVKGQMPLTMFPLRGECSEFTDVHGYVKMPLTPVKDLHHSACNVGFTVANALSTSSEVAIFLRSLLGQGNSILQPNTLKEMLKLRWLETGLGNKVSGGQFYGMGVRDLSSHLIMDNPMLLLRNPEIFFAGKWLGHDGASSLGFNSFNAYAPRYDFGMSFIMNHNGALKFWNFMSRKTYDLMSQVTPPVGNPTRATYENKEDFLNQKSIVAMKRLQAVR